MTEDTDKQYKLMNLKKSDLHKDPIVQFQKWYKRVLQTKILFPNAFILSTSDKNGLPSSRVLLLKDLDDNGFKFYTNEYSRKGIDLKENPNASICFWWDKLERQVRIDGKVTLLKDKESDEYFATRPRESQLGAWASDQSTIIESRKIIEKNYKKYDKKFANTKIPRPDYWKGYKLRPNVFEFWQGRVNRLHDRFRYVKKNNLWSIERLAP